MKVYSSNYTVYGIPLLNQSQIDNTTYSILYQVGDSLNDCYSSQNILQDNYTSTLSQDAAFLLLQLPRYQTKFVLCFILAVKFPDITIVIEGTFDLTDGTDTVSDVNVMLSTATVTSQYMPIMAELKDNKTLIIALTLCLMFIVLITIIIISLIIVIVKRRRKWHSALSNPSSNIYE